MCADSCGSIPITRLFSPTRSQLTIMHHVYLQWINMKAWNCDGSACHNWRGIVVARGETSLPAESILPPTHVHRYAAVRAASHATRKLPVSCAGRRTLPISQEPGCLQSSRCPRHSKLEIGCCSRRSTGAAEVPKVVLSYACVPGVASTDA